MPVSLMEYFNQQPRLGVLGTADKNGKPNKWTNRDMPGFVIAYCYQRGIDVNQFKGAKK